MNALDNINPAELGERLRKARANAGLTQEAIATELQVARTTLVAIEQGQRKVKPDELKKLSRLYQISINHLLQPEAVLLDLSAKFRKLRDNNQEQKHVLDAIKLLNKLAAASVELEQLTGRPMQQNYPAEQPIMPGDVLQQAEDTALDLRHRLALGLAPIPDIVALLEMELGIRVFIRPLHASISGLYVCEPTVGACILLNAKHPRERQALTAAHELGHFITERNTTEVYDDECFESNREERYANAFALAFLMPASQIRRRFNEICTEEKKFAPRHLILMAYERKVSNEAMCRRLEGLNLLPQGTYESLKEKGFNKDAVKQVLGDDAGNNIPNFSPRLSLLVAEAYEKGLLTEGQLCDKLELDHIEVRKLLDTFNAGDTACGSSQR